MSANDKATKDKNMASYLKKKGVQRTTARCPWGHLVQQNAFMNHLRTCLGASGKVKN